MNFYTQINEIGGNKLITYFEKIRTVVDKVDGFAPQGGLINTPELLNRQSLSTNGFFPCFLLFEDRFYSRSLSAILTTVLLLLQRTSLFVSCNNSGHTIIIHIRYYLHLSPDDLSDEDCARAWIGLKWVREREANANK